MRYGVAALMLAAALVAAWVGIAHDSRLASRRTEGRLATSAPAPRPRLGTKSIAAYELYRRGSDRTRFRSDSAMREGVELRSRWIRGMPRRGRRWRWTTSCSAVGSPGGDVRGTSDSLTTLRRTR